MVAYETKIPSKEEVCIRNFLYETGIGQTNDFDIDYKKLVNGFNIKKEYMHNIKGAKIILNVLISELGKLEITRPELWREFEEERLNVQYKRLMDKARIFSRENKIIVETFFYYDQDCINRIDEVLGYISDDWALQKIFGLSQKEQNFKIARIVGEEIKSKIKWFSRNILDQAKLQVIDKLSDEKNEK